MKSFICIGILLISALFCTHANAGVIRVDASGVEYRMDRHNTLWSVCKSFCKTNGPVMTDAIAKINAIKNVRKIPVGKHIHIPREYLGFTLGITGEAVASTAMVDAVAVMPDNNTIQELRSALESTRIQSAAAQRSAESLVRSLADEEQKLVASIASYDRVLLGFRIAVALLIILTIAILVMAIRRFSADKRVVYLKLRLELERLEDKFELYRFGTEMVSKRELIARVEEAIKACLIGNGAPASKDQKVIHTLADEGALVFEQRKGWRNVSSEG